MEIKFNFAEAQHPSGNVTIAELASILEGKYGIIKMFCEAKRPKLEGRIVEMYNRSGKIHLRTLQDWIKMEWREYVISGRAGFSAAAQSRGDPAFVDTSSYYLALQPECVPSKEERVLCVL